MSFFLQVATETADLIEYGEVRDGAEHNHSDFDRLLGVIERRAEQRRQQNERRERALAEIDEGREARAALRSRMQDARHEALMRQIAEGKEAARGAADEAARAASAAAAEAQTAACAHFGLPDAANDPFRRFRAEEQRVSRDRERLAEMTRATGVAGCDVLRRIAAGGGAEGPVPTVARLLSAGYGKQASQAVAADAVRSTDRVVQDFARLDTQDAAEIVEGRRRRAFYDRERLNMLRQMRELQHVRTCFSTTGAGAARATPVLGHDPADTRQARRSGAAPHPVDEYHACVRDAVIAAHEAVDPWLVVTARPADHVAMSARAASVAKRGS